MLGDNDKLPCGHDVSAVAWSTDWRGVCICGYQVVHSIRYPRMAFTVGMLDGTVPMHPDETYRK